MHNTAHTQTHTHTYIAIQIAISQHGDKIVADVDKMLLNLNLWLTQNLSACTQQGTPSQVVFPPRHLHDGFEISNAQLDSKSGKR